MCSSIFSKEVIQHDRFYVEKHKDMRTCTKFVQSTVRSLQLFPPDISAGLRPDPTGEAYSAPQTTYLDLRGPTSKEREGKERWREGEKRGRGGEDVCSRNFQLL